MDNGPNTSAEGAAVGAALGALLAWVAEVALAMDVPVVIEGAIVVVATYILARFIPPRS